MATRNISGSQSLNRTNTAPSSGSVLKSRQLVSLFLNLPSPYFLLISFLLCWFAQSRGLTREGEQAQLHSQLAQLSANLSDTENLLRMTSVQAEAMRGLGSWHGGL